MLQLRREHRSWCPRRLVYELLKRGVEPVPSETGVYQALKRAGLIEPGGRRRRKDTWKRWERGAAMGPGKIDIGDGSALGLSKHKRNRQEPASAKVWASQRYRLWFILNR